jgi:hypothetical protein
VWETVEERFPKKLSRWKSKLMSIWRRLVLINSMLSSLPMFMMHPFRIPKGVLKKLTIIGPYSYGKIISTKRNTKLLNGVFYVHQGVWVGKVS